MNYLMPNWRQSDANWLTDGGLSVVKLFLENEVPHQIIIHRHMPFLRYKAQEHTILSADFINVFDYLQDIQQTSGYPLTMDDLALPEDIETIYYPFGVLLLRSGEVYGKVSFNQYGCIESVHYEAGYRDFMDDRGFVSMREYYSDKTNLIVIKREYFNEAGRLTISESFYPEKKTTFFREDKNWSVTDIQQGVSAVINQLDEEETNNLVMFSDGSTFPLIASLSQNARIIQVMAGNVMIDEDVFVQTFPNTEYLVADTLEKQMEYAQIQQQKCSSETPVTLIPLFHTSLQLGKSNSIGQLIILWKIGLLDQRTEETHAALIQKLIANEKYSLLLHVDNHQDADQLRRIQKRMIDDTFGIDSASDEYKKVAKFIHAKRARRLFTIDEEAIVPIRKTALWRPLVAALAVYDRLEIKIAPVLSEVKRDLSEARVLLDIRDKLDLQLQSMAVSAGIPLLTMHNTDYTLHKENALIVRDLAEVEAGLSYFLDDLNNWNSSLVKSVELIDQYSAEILIKKWEEVLYGASN